ncbi:MAG: pyruvate, phosphate dikinase [Actinomycetota bacterium]
MAAFGASGIATPAERVDLLGGKGAALARMTELGLPVPPGFTLTTTACRTFMSGGWSAELDAALSAGVTELEGRTQKRFGNAANPLLVSVRSGAPVSMPGMMDTVLNVGINASVAQSLSSLTGDPTFGWDTWRRFAQCYASVVLTAPEELIRELVDRHLGPDEGRRLPAVEFAAAVNSFIDSLASVGYNVPDDATEQLRGAVVAVFASWDTERARVYRGVEGIADDLGTGATIQMMAFGNLGDRSGTGVAFSRDPSTGEPGLVGDFLRRAQGEDVVAGTHAPRPVADLRTLWPDIADELERTAELLERDLADIADIEFTIEQGTLWLLQVRRGKHSARAALRMAIDMAEEPQFPLTRGEALDRVAATLADPPRIANPAATTAAREPLTKGLGASPGRAIGAVCTDVDEAVAAGERGEPVILFRRETSPADIAGMAAAKGIVTSLGGLVSHAAVVARGWHVPAVVGASSIRLAEDGIEINETSIAAGTTVTIDGTTGDVYLGAHESDEIEAPEAAILRSWRDRLTPAAPESTASAEPGGIDPKSTVPEPANLETVGRVLAIKGMASAESISAVLGVSVADVAPVLAELVDAGDAQEVRAGNIRPLPTLTEQVDAAYRRWATTLRPAIDPLLDEFHHANSKLKETVTDWQMRIVDGARVPNDHLDSAWDADVIARLRSEVHTAIAPIIEAAAAAERRLARYGDRLERALAAVEAGDVEMLAHPFKDSYHTVWFELHEELIRLSGRNRRDEAAAGRA